MSISSLLKHNRQLVILLTLLLCVTSLWGISLLLSKETMNETPKTENDNRPVKTVLFIGNSRTHFHNMPYLFQQMAESSAGNYRFKVTMHAPGGNYFEDHLANAEVKQLLQQKWDYVVFQGGSPENTYPAGSESFLSNGSALIALTRQTKSQPVLLSAWTYEGDAYKAEDVYLLPYYQQYTAKYRQHIQQHGSPPAGKPAPESFYPTSEEKHYVFIQRDYHNLSARTKTPIVNAGEAFKYFRESKQSNKELTTDGNHPTLQGSYLVAAMFYVCFTGQGTNSIKYTPDQLTVSEAAEVLKIIDKHYPKTTCPKIL